MGDQDVNNRYANIPIPSYDEATSLTNFRGSRETSNGRERQGLLNGEEYTGYQAPVVESARSSVDSDLRLPDVPNGDNSRRQIEELDYLDPSTPDTSRRSPRLYHRARLRNKWWSQHLSNISATLSAIRIPSFRSRYTPVSSENTASDPTPPTRLTWLTRASQRIHIPEQYKLSAPTFARLLGLFTIVLIVYALFAMDIIPNRRYRGMGGQFDPESVRTFVQENCDVGAIESYLSHMTSFDHVAGTEGDLYMAKWMEERWREDGSFDEIAMLPYYVYLDYPVQGERGVSIVKPESKRWVAALEESQAREGLQQSLAWHGHSKGGEAEGHLIYANRGSREDYTYLEDLGIVTNGSIALVAAFTDQLDLAHTVRAAEEAGCVGVLIYSNPGDVPDDLAWQAPHDMLQRGSVSDSSLVLGDPLTPGFASTLDANRLDPHSLATTGLPGIPSFPLSWSDARVLIEALRGHGTSSVPSIWWNAPRKNALTDWWTGNAPSDSDPDVPIVHMKNLNDANPLQQIWNLHGMIEGIESPEKKVIIGTHRDSFCFGAVDAGSASAIMMELVTIFGALNQLGWRPLRTIEFVSWDGGAYNSIGSTEYVEENTEYIRQNGVAYLNVGAGVFGPDFRANGSPVWQRSLLHVLDRVSDPRSNNTSTLRPPWQQKNGDLDGLSSADGDYAPFQYIAGTSSLDFGFAGQPGSYPQGSCYDNLEWMTTFGDPNGMLYHKALAQIWALLILEIADRPLLPFDLRTYADAMRGYVDRLQQDFQGQHDVSQLREAVDLMGRNAEHFHNFEDVWTRNVLGSGGIETNQFAIQRREFNDRLAKFESALLDLDDVPGREQLKHVVFGPLASGGKGEFPAVRDGVLAGNITAVQIAIARAAERIVSASMDLMK